MSTVGTDTVSSGGYPASTIAARSESMLLTFECERGLVGSALAIQNSIGFAITVVSIAAATSLVGRWGVQIAWLLVPGPILGLIGLAPLLRKAADPDAAATKAPGSAS